MMTGGQYQESLQDWRATFFEGEQVFDLPGQPVLGDCVSRVAAEYDRLYKPGAASISALMAVSRSADELRASIRELRASEMMSRLTYIAIMTLTTVADQLRPMTPAVALRVGAYVSEAQHRDIRITHCITDAKGDRGRRPGNQDDPDAYVRVVDRSRRRGKHSPLPQHGCRGYEW